ncbi:MAG: Uma2 family endonuclease [Acidobacteriota bacterium]|nr:Uma2 family endonuclease [Acidobacteriota bacterium]
MLTLLMPSPGETFIFEPGAQASSESFFEQACELYPSYRIEQDSEGSVLVMSPTGGNSSFRNNAILSQLTRWASENGKGSVFESKALFVLPDGSKRGPDAAWVSNEKLRQVPPEKKDDFLPLVPEFIIELRSKSERLPRLQSKMQDWICNGVQLAWLIDADQKKIWIYRQDSAEPDILDGPAAVRGAGPVLGFQLEMETIWQGLHG